MSRIQIGSIKIACLILNREVIDDNEIYDDGDAESLSSQSMESDGA